MLSATSNPNPNPYATRMDQYGQQRYAQPPPTLTKNLVKQKIVLRVDLKMKNVFKVISTWFK